MVPETVESIGLVKNETEEVEADSSPRKKWAFIALGALFAVVVITAAAIAGYALMKPHGTKYSVQSNEESISWGGSVKSSVAFEGATVSDFPLMAGLNIPWNNFGSDLGTGSFDATWFEQYFTQAHKNNQNIARFWVHCDGHAGLDYNADGSVKGLKSSFASDLRQLVHIAEQYKVVIQLCLWSFDMCKDDQHVGYTHSELVSDTKKAASYVSNAFVPMMQAIHEYPNVIIEVINEPEWCMKGPGNTKDKVDPVAMQRFVAMVAQASHAAGRKVTVGSASLKWSSTASEAEASYWDDNALKKAAPSIQNGNLDFYNIHYYDWMHNDQWGYDPMRANTSHWKLSRPAVVAELPPKSKFYTPSETLSVSTNNGFKGVMFWAYNDPSFNIAPVISPLSQFATQRNASYDAILSYLSKPTPPPTPPPCTDSPPPGNKDTCAQQKQWGKCSASWMAGFCCKTCFDCSPSCGK